MTSTTTIKRILVTPGEPAGIGPDLCLQMNSSQFKHYEIVFIADPEILKQRAVFLGIKVEIELITLDTPVSDNYPGTLRVIPHNAETISAPGQPDTLNSRYLLQCLDFAVDSCLNGQAAAMVTGPLNKATINQSGIAFSGHTEYLQQRCHSDEVVMMLATEDLKVALVTTHLPLRAVPDAITKNKLNNVIEILTHSLKENFGKDNARILVAGLNPHAGEQGYLGREEIEIISPVIQDWQQRGFNLVGPLPADTLYAKHWLDQADATLAMYHDQGLPVLKHTGFGKAVNITLGLPIIRTSVDHGTAFDLAGTGEANTGSMIQAIKSAIEMADNKSNQFN